MGWQLLTLADVGVSIISVALWVAGVEKWRKPII